MTSSPKQPLRVLHVLDSFGLGGAQEVALNLVKHHDAERFAPEVACLYGRGPYWEPFRDLGVPVHSLSFHKFVPLYVPRLFALCRRRRFDLIHCHLIASNLIAKPVAAMAGIRVRFNHDHTHHLGRYGRGPRVWLDGFANRLSSHIIAVSSSTRDFLVQIEKIPEKKVSVILNGVDLERFRPRLDRRMELRRRWDLPSEAPVVLAVGRLSSVKNYGLLLRIAARIVAEKKDARFVIAGDGPEEASLRQQARNLGIEGNVRFLGFVPDMTELYPVADLFVSTSRFEGCPMTALEAMAGGIPIVAPSVGGFPQIIENGVDGVLVDPSDESAFVESVLALLGDRSKAESLGEGALKRARDEYSAETMTRAVEALYLRYSRS